MVNILSVFGRNTRNLPELHNKEMKGGQTEATAKQTDWPLDFPRALLSELLAAAAEEAKVCTIGGSTP